MKVKKIETIYVNFRMPSPQTKKRGSGIPTPALRNSNTSGNYYAPDTGLNNSYVIYAMAV
jgi:hypothetical protein